MPRTQEERKAETRSRLVAAAADLFARKGFHAVSAEAVADAADRTTGALYAHFGGKDGLLLALVEQWKQESADRILAGVEQAPTSRAACGRCGPTRSRRTSEHGDGWLLLEFELWLHAARDPGTASTPTSPTATTMRARHLAGPLTAWARRRGHRPAAPIPTAPPAS